MTKKSKGKNGQKGKDLLPLTPNQPNKNSGLTKESRKQPPGICTMRGEKQKNSKGQIFPKGGKND